MPTINIQIFEGRTVDQKRELVKAIIEADWSKSCNAVKVRSTSLSRTSKKKTGPLAANSGVTDFRLKRFHSLVSMKPLAGLFPETVEQWPDRNAMKQDG